MSARGWRLIRAASWLGAVAALAACVSTAPCGPSGAKLAQRGWDALKNHPECCYAYQQLSRLPLPAGSTPSSFDVDRERQTFRFGEDKAFVLMFELPAYRAPYAIRLSSLPLGCKLDAALFVPEVLMLDARYQVTRTFDDKTLRHRGAGLERTIFINPDNATERYMLIHGASRAGTTVSEIPVVSANNTIFGPLPFTFSEGEDVQARLSTSPVGRIEVLVQPAGEP
jgi:hypothetical protein